MENTKRKLAWDILQENIVIDEDMKIDKRTNEVLCVEVDYYCYKEKF